MDRAVQLVLTGTHDAKDAAEDVGLLAHAVQNIRKRVREERQRQEDNALAARALFTATKKAKTARMASRAPDTKAMPRHNYRKVARQVDVVNSDKHKWRRATIGGYKAATTDYQALLKTKRKRNDGGAETIAVKYNKALSAGAKPLTAQTIQHRVREGNAGSSPPRAGSKRSLPQVVYGTVATFVQMKQVGGDEQKPRALKAAVKAALKHTRWEAKTKTARQISRILQHVREDHPELNRARKCAVDDRRWQWTTYKNLSEWYDGFKAFLLYHGFATDEPEEQPDGRIAEVTIPPEKEEAHHELGRDAPQA